MNKVVLAVFIAIAIVSVADAASVDDAKDFFAAIFNDWRKYDETSNKMLVELLESTSENLKAIKSPTQETTDNLAAALAQLIVEMKANVDTLKMMGYTVVKIIDESGQKMKFPEGCSWEKLKDIAYRMAMNVYMATVE